MLKQQVGTNIFSKQIANILRIKLLHLQCRIQFHFISDNVFMYFTTVKNIL